MRPSAIVALCLTVFARPVLSQELGIFSDPAGTNCSLAAPFPAGLSLFMLVVGLTWAAMATGLDRRTLVVAWVYSLCAVAGMAAPRYVLFLFALATIVGFGWLAALWTNRVGRVRAPGDPAVDAARPGR